MTTSRALNWNSASLLNCVQRWNRHRWMVPLFPFRKRRTEADKSQIKVWLKLKSNRDICIVHMHGKIWFNELFSVNSDESAKDVDGANKRRLWIFFSIKIDVNWVLANQSKNKQSNWKSIDEMLPVLASGKLTHEYRIWCHILPLVFEFQFVLFSLSLLFFHFALWNEILQSLHGLFRVCDAI